MKTLKEILEGEQINEAVRLRNFDDIAKYIVDTLEERDVLYNIIYAVMNGEVGGVRHPGEMLDNDKFRTALFGKLSEAMLDVMNDNF